jgi:GDP-D-mannose dehydratase
MNDTGVTGQYTAQPTNLLLKERYMVHGIKNVVQGNGELKRVGGERLRVLSAAQ